MSFMFIKLVAGEEKDIRWTCTTPSGVTVDCIDHDTIFGNMHTKDIPAEDRTGIKRILSTLIKRGMIQL